MLCEYRNMFGRVAEGVHSYRIFDIAIVDVIFTILGAYLLHRLFPVVSFGWMVIGLFLLGIVMHRLFCVRTTVDRVLFP